MYWMFCLHCCVQLSCQNNEVIVTYLQVDDWVNRNIDDLPKVFESNSPVKKPWGDVDQVRLLS